MIASEEYYCITTNDNEQFTLEIVQDGDKFNIINVKTHEVIDHHTSYADAYMSIKFNKDYYNIEVYTKYDY